MEYLLQTRNPGAKGTDNHCGGHEKLFSRLLNGSNGAQGLVSRCLFWQLFEDESWITELVLDESLWDNMVRGHRLEKV